ncbi:MAG TPA: hypothetical protein VMC41_00935 [Candidatus Nanoarchaeia archaeon]|nr:hypothetical protein [Candidatus Nanoarchaeia archaeon]
MKKLVLAVFAVLTVIILPAGAAEALPEGVKMAGGKYFVYDFDAAPDSTGKIAPVAIFNVIQTPNNVALNKQWLISQSKRDSTVIEKKGTKFFWQGLLPKSRESKKLLVRKFYGADTVKFDWQEIPGQEKTPAWLITAIALLFVAPLLSGLSFRIKNNNVVAAVAMAAVAMAAVVAAVAAVAAMVAAMAAAVAMAAAALAAAALAAMAVEKDLKISASFLLISVALSAISIAIMFGLWPCLFILVIEALIFLTARYLKLGLAK